MTKYYAAYGSNLNKSQMRARCPKAKPLGAVELPKAQLVFNGVADVVFHETKTAMIGLWEITDACERELDMYEGVLSRLDGKAFKKGAYRKETIRVIVTEAGAEVERDAVIYVMNRDDRSMPMLSYLNTIKAGFKDFGLDDKWLREALVDTREHMKAQAEERAARWAREDAERKSRPNVPEYRHVRSPHHGITDYYSGPAYSQAQADYYDQMRGDDIGDLFQNDMTWDDGEERPTPKQIMDELAREEMSEMAGIARKLRTEQDYRNASERLDWEAHCHGVNGELDRKQGELNRKRLDRHNKSGYKVPKNKSPHLFDEPSPYRRSRK